MIPGFSKKAREENYTHFFRLTYQKWDILKNKEEYFILFKLN
jgi:hypothetical protein